jgi:hypothetical protein
MVYLELVKRFLLAKLAKPLLFAWFPTQIGGRFQPSLAGAQETGFLAALLGLDLAIREGLGDRVQVMPHHPEVGFRTGADGP